MTKNIMDLSTTKLYKYFWEFLHDRHEIFLKRNSNEKTYSTNQIISNYKFTNIYRVLDKTTQYLVKNIINDTGDYSNEDILFRILLFKIFNKIETWIEIEKILIDISWTNFNLAKYVSAFDRLYRKNLTIYSAAYIMPTKISSFNYKRKYKNHLYLLNEIMNSKLLTKIQSAVSLEQVYKTLRDIPSFGDFLAYQYTIDINYSKLINFDENDFVIAGPGAKRGIRKAFKNSEKFTDYDIINLVRKNQRSELKKYGYTVNTLQNRELKLIDIQNIFCEFDKYTRVNMKSLKNGIIEFDGNMRIKQKYKPISMTFDIVFPSKWGDVRV